MSISQNELFDWGYNPSSWYAGYDESWILKAVAASNSVKEAEKKQEEAKKMEAKGIIELRMPLCCDGCIEKVHRKLKAMDGVGSVVCDQEKQKVVVKGDAKPEAVLKKAQKIFKRSEFWNTKEKNEERRDT